MILYSAKKQLIALVSVVVFLTLVHLLQRLADKDSSAPESEGGVVNKERKKITFADEAGEKLCHVRFIENKLTSSLEPDTEKPEVLN